MRVLRPFPSSGLFHNRRVEVGAWSSLPVIRTSLTGMMFSETGRAVSSGVRRAALRRVARYRHDRVATGAARRASTLERMPRPSLLLRARPRRRRGRGTRNPSRTRPARRSPGKSPAVRRPATTQSSVLHRHKNPLPRATTSPNLGRQPKRLLYRGEHWFLGPACRPRSV